jgi:hypothetical protein
VDRSRREIDIVPDHTARQPPPGIRERAFADLHGIFLKEGEEVGVVDSQPDYVPPSTRPYATQKAFSPVAAAIDCVLWRYRLVAADLRVSDRQVPRGVNLDERRHVG